MNPDIRRAEEAKRLLAEPMLQEAFNTVETGLIEAMKNAKLGDQLTHHELVLCLQLLGRVRGYFQEAIDTGKMLSMTERQAR